MKIDLENLFAQKIVSGINLFTGAGFSVLPSPSGDKLPTGKEFCEEVITKFNLQDISADKGLSYISEFCPDQEYQDFLRERFTVHSYNPLYDQINKINMRTYVTTNIDNIIRLVMASQDITFLDAKHMMPNYFPNYLPKTRQSLYINFYIKLRIVRIHYNN